MEDKREKIERLRQLRQEVMALEGSLPSKGKCSDRDIQLGPLAAAFPGKILPLGVNHEFISTTTSEAASTQGFLAAILGMLLRKGGYCLWLGNRPRIFPPALGLFGVAPHRVLFADVPSQKDLLWTLEQSLKCDALVAVVGELKELGFAESQRLQLAVERSRVTGFLHRHQPGGLHALACATRWKIAPLVSQPEAGMPGVGFPTWNVELLKVRQGRPGSWHLEWKDSSFQLLNLKEASGNPLEKQRYA